MEAGSGLGRRRQRRLLGSEGLRGPGDRREGAAAGHSRGAGAREASSGGAELGTRVEVVGSRHCARRGGELPAGGAAAAAALAEDAPGEGLPKVGRVGLPEAPAARPSDAPFPAPSRGTLSLELGGQPTGVIPSSCVGG